jgi:hypothetical protein
MAEHFGKAFHPTGLSRVLRRIENTGPKKQSTAKH